MVQWILKFVTKEVYENKKELNSVKDRRANSKAMKKNGSLGEKKRERK